MKSVSVYTKDGATLLHTYSDISKIVRGNGEILIYKIEETSNELGVIDKKEICYSFSDQLPYIEFSPKILPEDSTFRVPEYHLAKAYFDMLRNSGIIEHKGPWVECEDIQMPRVRGYSGFLEFLSSLEKPENAIYSLERKLDKKLDEMVNGNKKEAKAE